MKQFSIILAVLFCCLVSRQSYASEIAPGSLSGTIIDQNLQQPIPYATVTLKNEATKALVTGVVTNEEGFFELKDLEYGSYTVEITFVGYKTLTKTVTLSKNNKKVDLGTIELAEDVTELEGVTVVEERSTIEQKVDRKVINIGKDLTTAGAAASDIMNNIPSVNMDQDGNLSLRGNQNVRVMIDGKLSNVPVAQLLKQIPSSSIKSIELITNPSAKYNPEGMSGIINIILHKNANIGFNGSINLGLTQAIEPKFNSSVNLNYRNGKFNFYGNYGNNLGKYVNDGNVSRLDDNSAQIFDNLNNNKSHLFKVGVDFYLNDNNTFSVFTNQNYFDGEGDGLTNILYYDNPSLNSSQAFFVPSNNRSSQYNFDYKHTFSDGHSIELEADYNDFTNNEDASYVFENSDATDYEDFVDTNRDQTTINLDYVNPLNDHTKLEAGAQARLFSTNVDYNSTGFSFNSSGEIIPTPSTNFDYGIDIYSGYVTFGQHYEKWSYQLGARLEDVTVKADTNYVSAFTDKYTQVYPSAFVSYTPSEKNTYQVSFSRRVDRPGLQQVNPIREFSTPRISSYGNPELRPQFTNSIDVNYTRKLKAGSITSGVFYRRINDDINRTVSIDPLDETKQIISYDNFDNSSSYGLELSSNYKPLSFWNFNASFDLFSQTQKGYTNNEYIEVDNVTYNFRMNNNFPVTKKVTLSLFAFYRGPNKSLQFNPEAMYFINTGARYSFAQGKGMLSLNFNDVFNTQKFQFTSDNPYQQEGKFNWESQSVYVGVSYSFGGNKFRARNRKQRDDNTKNSGGGLF